MKGPNESIITRVRGYAQMITNSHGGLSGPQSDLVNYGRHPIFFCNRTNNNNTQLLIASTKWGITGIRRQLTITKQIICGYAGIYAK